MVEFKLKALTWGERKELRGEIGALGSHDLSNPQNMLFSVSGDFIENCFRYGIEGYQADDWQEKLNQLSETELMGGVAEVIMKSVYNMDVEIEKKS